MGTTHLDKLVNLLEEFGEEYEITNHLEAEDMYEDITVYICGRDTFGPGKVLFVFDQDGSYSHVER